MFSWLFSDPLSVGSDAPPFTLQDDSGTEVSLEKLRGKNVVLVWYPGDDTRVCREQLCEFRDSWSAAVSKNVKVFGVNPQKPESHTKFRQKYSFPFPLLVDPGQKVGSLYHTSGLIVKRTVYLIDPNGKIRYAKRGKPDVSEVLASAL